MAKGALKASRADVAVSATGIAGPGGGGEDKPVGLVFLGWASKGGPARAVRHVFPGNRGEVRNATVRAALDLFKEALG
jgi:nicotinamide-nucleotide amidase